MMNLIIPLVDWSMGIIAGIFMFAVFVVLAIWLIIMMTGGKKK